MFADDAARLAEWRERAAAFLARRRLSLHPGKTRVAPTAVPATFLGFELRPGGQRRLPEANVRRFHKSPARAAGPLAGGHGDAGGGGAASSRLDGARGARRHVGGCAAQFFRDGWFAPCGLPVPGA